MDRIAEIRGFVAVAEALSFARGAARLGVSPAQASKLVARLEDRLDARLLNRTTRDVSLTDTGRAYLDRARALVEEFDALETSVRDTSGPSGLLRISVPVSFGEAQLEPVLLDFAAAYPAVSVEVFFSDRTVNLVDEGFDAAVRITRMGDSSLVARKLGVARIVTCASPEYIARHGEPQTPGELAARDTILDLNLKEPTVWDFRGPDGHEQVRVAGRLRFSNPYFGVAAAAKGFGIARAPAFVAAEALRDGRVKTLLCPYEPEPIGIHAVYPHGRHLAAKVRVFVDFLAKRFAGEPQWHQGWACA